MSWVWCRNWTYLYLHFYGIAMNFSDKIKILSGFLVFFLHRRNLWRLCLLHLLLWIGVQSYHKECIVDGFRFLSHHESTRQVRGRKQKSHPKNSLATWYRLVRGMMHSGSKDQSIKIRRKTCNDIYTFSEVLNEFQEEKKRRKNVIDIDLFAMLSYWFWHDIQKRRIRDEKTHIDTRKMHGDRDERARNTENERQMNESKRQYTKNNIV